MRIKISAAAFAMFVSTVGLAAAETNTDEAQAHRQRGIELYSQGDPRGAKAELDRAIALRPDFAEAYSDRCFIQVEAAAAILDWATNGSWARGMEDCTKAIALAPDWTVPYLNRGFGYLVSGDFDRALADSEKAIALDPRSGAAYGSRGLVRYRLHDNGRALEDLNQAVALDPNDWRNYFFRAVVKSELGDKAGSQRDCGKALTLDPQHRKVLRYTGEAPNIFSCKLS